MRPEREGTTTVLIDIAYRDSLNKFEETYGEFITYKEMEQTSYVEFKEVLFERINNDIKFRKFGRIGQNLTIKAEMMKKEIDRFKKMLDDNFALSTNWTVKEVTIIKNTEKNNKILI